MLPQEAVEEFKALFRAETGEDVADEEAKEGVEALLRLYSAIITDESS